VYSKKYHSVMKRSQLPELISWDFAILSRKQQKRRAKKKEITEQDNGQKKEKERGSGGMPQNREKVSRPRIQWGHAIYPCPRHRHAKLGRKEGFTMKKDAVRMAPKSALTRITRASEGN